MSCPVEVVEASLGDARHDLRPHTCLPRGLVRDDDASGLAHGRGDGGEVHGRQRPQVDDLE
jgi:hypothetical protein